MKSAKPAKSVPRIRWRPPLAMLLLALFCALFLLAGEEWIPLRKAVLGSQFTTGISHTGGRLLVALVILAVTAALGRWYCSLLCPAGLAQDLFTRIGRKIGLSRLAFAKPPFILNVVFMISAIAFAGIAVLDPLALFGSALASGVWIAAVAGVVFLVLVPLFWGRLFCDAVCPVGTLFRLLGRLRLPGFRMRLDGDKCVSCGKCGNVCPTRCVDVSAKTIDAGRCVLCFDCANSCAADAVSYGMGGSRGVENGEGKDGREGGARRNFLGSVGASVGAVVLGGGYVASREAKLRLGVDYADPARIAPPGTGGTTPHAAKCVGCQACALSCPVGIIRSDGGDSRPLMNYQYGYCQYACMNCLKSCPAGVFAHMTPEEKQRTRIAKVELEIDRCVVITLNQACGACAEVCPTHAVTMVKRDGYEHTVPDFAPEYCIGCGACYHACPVNPRAFTVSGLARHEISAGIRDTGSDARDAGTDAPVDWENAEGMAEFPF